MTAGCWQATPGAMGRTHPSLFPEGVENAGANEARAGFRCADGFEIRDWQGLEGLGHRRIAVVRTYVYRSISDEQPSPGA